MKYCVNCDDEATFMIERKVRPGEHDKNTPLCFDCGTAYLMGQASPDAHVARIEEDDND